MSGYGEAAITNKKINEQVGKLMGIDMEVLHLTNLGDNAALPALNYLRTVESHCKTVQELLIARRKGE